MAADLSINTKSQRQASLLMRFRQNRDGVTAVEFGFVAVPFLLFAVGIIAIGIQFFTINALDFAVETASRKIRTGQAQRENLTMGQFKQLVCESGGYYLEKDCDNITLHVQSAGSWAEIDPVACAADGQMTAQSNTTAALADSAGGGSQVVLVTVCYDWQMPLVLPYLKFILQKPADGVPLESGGSLIQSVATFRSEAFS
jgi:Flp pilus assembly protein TadG